MESSETTIQEQYGSFGMITVLIMAWGGGSLISLFIKGQWKYAKRHLKTKTVPLE